MFAITQNQARQIHDQNGLIQGQNKCLRAEPSSTHTPSNALDTTSTFMTTRPISIKKSFKQSYMCSHNFKYQNEHTWYFKLFLYTAKGDNKLIKLEENV